MNYKECSENSTSSVEYPVEGKYTDDKSEREASDPGNRLPIFSQQALVPNFMICANATLQAPACPPAFYGRIPKSKKNKSSAC